jgi:mono/diheme cytochrome c family protein
MRLLLGICLVLVMILLLGGVFVGSGMYEVGADEPHWPLTARVLDLLRNRSVTSHARAVVVPDLDNPQLRVEGARHYAAMCEGCHRAPGKEESEMRRGLYPRPPNLIERGVQDDAEAFWIIKHGIKMTAMPAWGQSHSDDSIWALVAFLKKLPDLSPEQYAAMVSRGRSHTHHAESEVMEGEHMDDEQPEDSTIH